MTYRAGRPLLLVNIEGASWHKLHNLLDAGLLPNLAELVRTGSMGNVRTGPPLDPALVWNSLVTGQPAAVHGIASTTLKSGGPALSSDRRAPTVWDIASAEGITSAAVGGWTTHYSGERNTCIVSEFFGSPDLAKSKTAIEESVVPAAIRDTIAECWVRPEEIDADTIEWFVSDWLQVDQDSDPRLAMIGNALALTLSRHVAFSWLLEHRSPRLAVVNYSLVDEIGRLFAPFDKPESPHIPAEQAQLFGDVVDRAYQLVDLFLGRLLELTDEDAHVLVTSMHGHRPLKAEESLQSWFLADRESRAGGDGFLILSGAQAQRDALIFGCSVLDIVPTALHLLGLSHARDMPGRVLAEALTQPPTTEPVRSWQHHLPVSFEGRSALDGLSERSGLKQVFGSLGVLGDSAAPGKRAGGSAHDAKWRWNYARACMQSGHVLNALPELEYLAEQYPEHPPFQVTLLNCQLALGLVQEAQQVAEELREYAPDKAIGYLSLARVAHAAGRYEESLSALKEAEEQGAGGMAVNLYAGLAYSRLRRWPEAIAAYDRVLANQQDSSEAWRGKARALLGMKQFDQAGAAALEAIRLDYQAARLADGQRPPAPPEAPPRLPAGAENGARGGHETRQGASPQYRRNQAAGTATPAGQDERPEQRARTRHEPAAQPGRRYARAAGAERNEPDHRVVVAPRRSFNADGDAGSRGR
jgi:tetratricopeptide (TPR) repeat protein